MVLGMFGKKKTSRGIEGAIQHCLMWTEESVHQQVVPEDRRRNLHHVCINIH